MNHRAGAAFATNLTAQLEAHRSSVGYKVGTMIRDVFGIKDTRDQAERERIARAFG
jgi:hypothetical protein